VENDETYRSLMNALRRANEARDRSDGELAELRARFEQLVTVLTGKGILAEGHHRLLDRVGRLAAGAQRPKVRLRQYVDKYELPGGDIDCAARLPLCHGRCCALSFELTTQDLDEGGVRWELDEPYVIRHDRDGYCTHLDRATLGCTIYERRPATCRGFDCREDRRIWIDFEKRIPAPMPDGLAPPRC
jgi:Fe-S-cluster containining protein